MSDFKIEKNVPIPETRGGPHGEKYPWHDMEPGDSFFIPGKTSNSFGYISATNRRLAPKRFISRTVEGGVRVWRVDGLNDTPTAE